MSRDMILSTTVAPCANSSIAWATASFGIGGRECRHHRDVIGIEQPLDLDRVEPVTAIGQRSGHDPPCGLDVGRKFARHGRRNLRQRLHHLAMSHEVHEAAHRVIFGRIIRNSGAAQKIADLLDPPRPRPRAPAWARMLCSARYFWTTPVTAAAMSSAGAIAV